MRALNHYEKGFIECFIDTDGSIYLKHGRNTKQLPKCIVSFCNNSEEYKEKMLRLVDEFYSS